MAPSAPSSRVRFRSASKRHKGGAAQDVLDARSRLWWHQSCLLPDVEHTWKWLIAISCLFCLLWVGIVTFIPAPFGTLNWTEPSGTKPGFWELCPRVTVCAQEWYTILLLGISRSTAYVVYPLMILLFLSKTNHLRTILQRSFLALYVPFYDLHQIHTFSGKVVSVAITIHSITHIVRWAINGTIMFLFQDVTGVSGLISFICMPLIVLPFVWKPLKKRMSWEWRKGLHYLSIVWGFAIIFHAPVMKIAWLMGIPVTLYLIDYVVGAMFRTYRVDSSLFARLENGVELTFEHPEGFSSDGTGYVMLCLPWISKFEWHAFSLFAHPSESNHSCVCMDAAGDWTKKLHQTVQRPTRRPAWICGPFASPYSTAIEYDNLILVASGIGITPAMSIVTTYQETRRVNLIWVCRDAALLEFYLDKCSFDTNGWTLVYYTGKRKLNLPHALARNVLVFEGRPNLVRTICEVIGGIESGNGLPEELLLDAEETEERWTTMDNGRFTVVGKADELKSRLAHSASASYGLDCLTVSERFRVLIRRSLSSFGEEALSIKIAQLCPSEEANRTMTAAEVRAVLEAFFAPVVEEGQLTFSVAEEAEIISLFAWADDSAPLEATNSTSSCLLRDVQEACAQEMGAAMTDKSTCEEQIRNLSRVPSGALPSPPNKRSSASSADRRDVVVNNFRAASRTLLTEKKKRRGLSRFRTWACNTRSQPLTTVEVRAGGSQPQPIAGMEAQEKDFVESIGAEHLATWQMLYCGGSQPVVDVLVGIQRAYGVKLRTEKFDW